jgi:hypothetical protein
MIYLMMRSNLTAGKFHSIDRASSRRCECWHLDYGSGLSGGTFPRKRGGGGGGRTEFRYTFLEVSLGAGWGWGAISEILSNPLCCVSSGIIPDILISLIVCLQFHVNQNTREVACVRRWRRGGVYI